jgi:hypothetical protein
MLCLRAGEIWGVNTLELKGQRRCQAIARPRQAVMYVAVKELGLSTGVVGNALGGRDHSTVMHGCKAVLARVDANPAYRAEVKALIAYSQEIPQSAFLPDTREIRDVRVALERAAQDAVAQLIDLAVADPDAFRELLADVMRGNLKRRIERVLASV